MVADIVESFHEYFDMVPATSETSKEFSYRLRYKVYCLETGFEKPEDFPDGLEKDEYDDYSEHYLIRHRGTNEYAATTRLILPDANKPEWVFPIERHSRLERTDLLENIPRNRIAEVSRFCLSDHFKRREGESHTLAGIGHYTFHNLLGGDSRKRVFGNYFTLALIACLVRMSVQHGITHWFAFMELPFARLLRGWGISSTPLGPLVEYHGWRRPYLIKIADLLAGAKLKNIDIWKVLTNHGNFWQESDPDMVKSLRADGNEIT